jgi:hypothetical protein
MIHVIFSCEKKTGILIFQVKINLFDVIKAIPMIKNYSYYFYIYIKKTLSLGTWPRLKPKGIYLKPGALVLLF